MSKEEKNTITINLLVIGDENIGKKTFISRLNKMPCTISHKSKNKFKTKTEKKEEKKEDDEEKDINEEMIREKEPIYIPPPSSNQLEYKLGSTILTIQAFIIDGATKVQINEDISSDEEDEEIINEYQIRFSLTKKCIYNYLKILNNNEENNINENIFLFMYDLSDFTTFERMMLYYDSINRKFNLKENKFKCIIIGNKSEKKTIIRQDDNEKMETFFNLDSNFKIFEISNKLHFNFSKFLGELIESCVGDDAIYDKEKLRIILENKNTFNKSKRGELVKINDNPGPDEYNVDIYDFSSLEERNEILSDNTKRFNNKIFVDKKGPIYHSNKKEEERKLRTKEEKRKKKKIFQSQFQSSINKNLNINNVYTGKTSYTMSGGDCHYNLRSERIKLIEKRNKEYLNAFGDNILSSINQPFNIKIKDDKYFEEINNRRLEYQKNLIEERKSKMGKFTEMREKNSEKLNEKLLIKSQSYKERYKEYDAEKAKQRFLNIVYGNNSKFINRSNSQNEKLLLKKEKEKNYIPPLYDIRGDLLNPKKGAIILGRREYKEKETNNAPFIYFKTDFDKILDKQKEGIISYVPRYKENILKDIKEKPKKIFDESKFEKYKENRNNSERNLNIFDFLTNCKLRKERHDDLMKSIKENNEEYHKALFRQYYRNNSEEMEKFPPSINYNLVEEKSPCYTIKGRYENKKYDNSNYFSVNGKKIYLDSENLPNPNINAIKWKLPSFSFGNEERFHYKKKKDEKKKEIKNKNEEENNNKEYYSDYDYNNGLSDRKDFSKMSIYDSKSKRHEFDNFVKNNPGPGQYKIKGFADEIIEKYSKIHNIKKLNDLGKNDIKKYKENKSIVTGHTINSYMNEFNDENNDDILSRNKSDIGEKIKTIRSETTNEITYKTNSKIEDIKKDNKEFDNINDMKNENINNDNIENIDKNIDNKNQDDIQENNSDINFGNNNKIVEQVHLQNDNKEKEIQDEKNIKVDDIDKLNNDNNKRNVINKDNNNGEIINFEEPVDEE